MASKHTHRLASMANTLACVFTQTTQYFDAKNEIQKTHQANTCLWSYVPSIEHRFYYSTKISKTISIPRQLCAYTQVQKCLHQLLAFPWEQALNLTSVPVGRAGFRKNNKKPTTFSTKAVKQAFSPLTSTRPTTARPPVSC